MATPQSAAHSELQIPASRTLKFDDFFAALILIGLTLAYMIQCFILHQVKCTRAETARMLKVAARLETLYASRPHAPAAGDGATRTETVYILPSQDVPRVEGGEEEHGVHAAPPPYRDDDDAGPAAQEVASADPESEELLGSLDSDGEEIPALQESV